MKEYVTRSGQTFDQIAFELFGDCKYTPDLINANRDFLNIYTFPAGVKLVVPEIDKKITASSKTLPLWER